MVEEGEVVLDLDGDIPLPTFDSPPSWLADPHDEGTDDDGAVNVDAFMAAFDGELERHQVVLKTLDAEDALQQEAAMERARLRHLATKAEVFAIHELDAVNTERAARVAVRDATRAISEKLRDADNRALLSGVVGSEILRDEYMRHEIVLKDRLAFLHDAEIIDLNAELGDVPRKKHIDHALHDEQWRSQWASPPNVAGRVKHALGGLLSPVLPAAGQVSSTGSNAGRDDTASSASRFHAARRAALEAGSTTGGIGALDRRWRATSKARPTPIEIHIEALRAVKDKVPAGEYCVVATLCDSLGGSPLYWSKGRGPMGGGAHPATTPVSHQGRFFDIDLFVQQSMYMAAPPPETLRPSHVWILELFLLSNRDDEADADELASRTADGKDTGKSVSDEAVVGTGSLRPLDLAVGWCCLPVCGAGLAVAEGKFRLPMLRGGVDSTIDSYAAFERRIAEDVDSWLCNIYLSVRGECAICFGCGDISSSSPQRFVFFLCSFHFCAFFLFSFFFPPSLFHFVSRSITALPKELLEESDIPDSEFDLTHPPTAHVLPKEDADGAAALAGTTRYSEAAARLDASAGKIFRPFWMFGGVRGAHREAIARVAPFLAPLMGVEPPANASTDSVSVLNQVVSSGASAVTGASASAGDASAAAIRGANLEPLPWTRHAGVDPRQLRLWHDELREELVAQAAQTDAVVAEREKLQQQHEFLTKGIPEYTMSMTRDKAKDNDGDIWTDTKTTSDADAEKVSVVLLR